ncbi:synembryn-A [Schistocerca nitens]|uniref:synembryn-A n=1 Tax=Schistocerca nitens TaxID=7011 RepID=UPI0021199B05|nr:synembryn-A [Schistocerca nitens]
MDDNSLFKLESGSIDEASTVVKDFAEKHIQTYSFHENDKETLERLWAALFRRLENENSEACHKYCLICIRLLSRDKVGLCDHVTEKRVETLLKLAGLVPQEEALSKASQKSADRDVMLEALKALCNIVYNSQQAQAICGQNHAVEAVIIRMRTYPEGGWPITLKYFDMKLLFLITALCSSVRPTLRGPLHGYTYLVASLDLILKQSKGKPLMGEQVQFVCEILKVLFNLSLGVNQTEEEPHHIRLGAILYQLLLLKSSNPAELNMHAVNLLVSLPGSCYSELLTLADRLCPPELECEGYNMAVVEIILELLDEKLEDQVIKKHPESLCPLLTVLAKGARYQRPIRKFLRARILPPLGEQVLTRPEEGDTMRNKLCRLLTAANPDTNISQLAADLLFVLCKENVGRMVKYTGYGNAAGLLANKGLMLGGDGKKPDGYSSDSEDSDTEEYQKYRDSVNPVTGCYEPPKPDPTAGMSDEQKEYEAMQLVNMMDQLTRDALLQPCRIGEDGRPEPVVHVLQLLEELPPEFRQQNNPFDDSNTES